MAAKPKTARAPVDSRSSPRELTPGSSSPRPWLGPWGRCLGGGKDYGWDSVFGAAGIGMLVGLLIYLAGQRHLPPDQMVTAREKMPVAPLDRRLLEVLAGVFILTTCFLILGGQLGNVYGLWLHSSVDRKSFGIIIPVTWFQSL